ncbi:Hpt domain-containing protein [Kordiimonas marina]|uniref:Hpt domain-containing protein n=1 Tax=Kordiimonas marina TaxID=2872312 RepID=UPI001FF4F2D0|nr:Hpt domain-containing protein [Kordiimonas marina]MCJ9428217.1 Hpt domain-containing protein [Kordiimonas marina]
MAETLAIVDQRVLDQLAEDVGAETLPVLIASLKREIAGAQAALPEHLAAGDMEQLEIGSHALKSAARSFGAMRLGEACLALEEAARDGAGEEALHGLMDKFLAQAEETLAAFELMFGAL